MALKFYFDTHIAKAIAVQLRAHGVGVVRCEEVDMAEASDEEHLRYAADKGFVIVSHDRHFLILDARWRAQSTTHSGIFFAQQYLQGNVGYMVKRLFEYAELIELGAGTIEDDIANRVTYIG